MSSESSARTPARFPTLSRVPWHWTVYLALYIWLGYWSDEHHQFEKELAFALVAASPLLWIMEIVTLKPWARRLLFSFNGRAPRSMYWLAWTTGFNGIALCRVGLSTSDELFLSDLLVKALALTWPLALLWAVAAISMEVRRWHDLNCSGWFYLVNFIPFAQLITYPYLLFFRGSWGTNRFGNDPLSRPDTEPSPFGAVTLWNIGLAAFFIAFTTVAFKYFL
jgi:uncharacterized membrane protein YhaH (DUF805 family)